MRPSTLYRYHFGKVQEASSKARGPLARMLWIRLVAIATIMSPMSITPHSGVRDPSAKPARTRIRPWRRRAHLRVGTACVIGPWPAQPRRTGLVRTSCPRVKYRKKCRSERGPWSLASIPRRGASSMRSESLVSFKSLPVMASLTHSHSTASLGSFLRTRKHSCRWRPSCAGPSRARSDRRRTDPDHLA
jgi:hypothetical protein